MVTMPVPPRHLAAPAVALALLLGACSSGGNDHDADDAARTTSTTASNGASDTTTSDASTTVDANAATVAELTAAFEADGISNASRWAREVEEYRPYPTDDPTFAKLREKLKKYNPSSAVVDQIVAALTL
jgi:hypothetical protein